MPHKHKRKRGDDDLSFDLPPTQKALPLPVTLGGKVQKGKGKGRGKSSAPSVPNKRHQTTMKDDTPKAFKRLMRVVQGGKHRSGLDDGLPKSDSANSSKPKTELPTIKPGEDLRSFASRVDASLPVSGLTNKTVVKDGKDSLGLKVRQTRREKKLHKLYDQWRAEDQKVQDRREEEKDLAEEKELDDEAAGVSWNSVVGNAQARRKGGKGRRDAADDDPWAELMKKRGKASSGLHDVALAPPELHKKQTRLLSVRDAAVEVGSAPKAAGSLRQREELEKTRQQVVDAYRKIREHEQKKLEAQAAK